MWRKEVIPQDFKDASIIHLFKWKGNPQLCDNHRGISLLSIAGKVLTRILLNRLNKHLEQSGLLPESQCGFRKDRGTIDMIFTARQLQEKCQKQNMDFNMTFVDFITNSNILKILQPKKWKFTDKNSDIFHISAQNLDCGYSLEPPRRGGSNKYPQSMFLSRNKKNNVYPCKPQFYYIKVGFKGVSII